MNSSINSFSGQVMYGGRVIDGFDRRIVATYMDEYFGDFLFDAFQPFHFYRDDTADYRIPPNFDSKQEYMGTYTFDLKKVGNRF